MDKITATQMRNEAIFKPIQKHFNANSHIASFEKIKISSRAVDAGIALFDDTIRFAIETIKTNPDPVNNAEKYLTAKKEAAVSQLIEKCKDDINALPKKYSGIVREFIADSIDGGVKFRAAEFETLRLWQ